MGTTSLILVGWYLRRRALAEDPQLLGLRRWVLPIAAWPGTDLRDAHLTDANFSGARMAYARLGSPADLTRTRFRGALDLHIAHVRRTILADRRVRELLVSGDGAGSDFDHADLHGAWLAGANLRGARLCDAELTGADLTHADLTDADLSRATLIGADLTGATLTGALLDGWNIDTATRLDGVVADYVFLEAGPNGERRERRPQGDGTFGPGDFTTLFKQALKTVDLIFRNGIDWDAFRAAFDDLRAHYAESGDGSEAQVRVQSIDTTEDGRIIVRIAVPDQGDKDADYRRLVAGYEQRLIELEAERGRLAVRLEHHEELVASERRHNAVLERMIDAAIALRPQPVTIHHTILNAREIGQMTSGDTIHQSGNFSGSIINIKSRLEQVSQGIGTLPQVDDAAKERLTALLAQFGPGPGTAGPDTGGRDGRDPDRGVGRQGPDRTAEPEPPAHLRRWPDAGGQVAGRNRRAGAEDRRAGGRFLGNRLAGLGPGPVGQGRPRVANLLEFRLRIRLRTRRPDIPPLIGLGAAERKIAEDDLTLGAVSP
ncbi:pentapeptide repeat-containing protein [uncultured Thiodictyon sp.]|uniref:pentapeptide repeat-containing protein n=1 Tax=uncultured Thiodictyon sp. TaxID=1846217 RepID=UPI0025D6AED5|nr:pentapeptide repeat-containing protein [uncultured Thiodictyon sp.]